MKLCIEPAPHAAEEIHVLKGHGFSHAKNRTEQNAALQVAEKGLDLIRTPEKHPPGAKARIDFRRLTARLKSCPDTKQLFETSFTGFSAASLAAEGRTATENIFPQRLKPRSLLVHRAARLKLCPDASYHSKGVFPQPVKPSPFKAAACAIVTAICFTAFAAAAQTTPATPQEKPKGQVIFSRSTDENGQTTTQAAPATPAPPQVAASELAPPQVAERQAVAFTAFDLDVRLRPAGQQIAVRALVTVRNDGKNPLTRLPLQISSSLTWERIRFIAPDGQGKDVAFQAATLNSDADHTGQLHEAIVPLDKTSAGPLAPGQSLQLDVTYSGQIAASAQRLLAIGTPDGVARHSDWDQISLPFTGLRGFGNVVWYPVASVPVILGDGARLFEEMGGHKLRLSGAHFRLRLTVEFPHGHAPTVALINGHAVPLTITEPNALDQSQEVAGVATADSGLTTLGFEAPSLFVAIRTPHPGLGLTAWTLPDDDVSITFWTTAAGAATSLLQNWLGQQPRSQLTLLDLPEPEDAPFETGALLAAPLTEPDSKATSTPDALTGVLTHALTHAWITPPNPSAPPPAWLNEGLATFMGALWAEKQHGRDAALRTLASDRAALALAEPESPGLGDGQPLAQAVLPVYYRTKAAYVLWMLRGLAGDTALSAALRAYQPAGHSSLEQLLEQSENSASLTWFFADWVDADKGLPDLSIAGVFPTSASAGNWLVAVNLANSGYAQAEVQLAVRSGEGSGATSVTRRVRVPARGKTTERILIQGKPTEVQLNDGSVPETQASVHVTKLD